MTNQISYEEVTKDTLWVQPFWRTIWNYAQKALKDHLPFDTAISLLGFYPKEIIRKKTCTKTFIAMLFMVAKRQHKTGK